MTQLWGEDVDGLAQRQRNLLAAMFDDPGLTRLRTRHPSHPAVVQHDRLLELERSGVPWPDELPVVNAVSEIGLDFSTWAPTPPFRKFWDFLDKDTAQWTSRTMENPDQYGDVMAELFVWGWLNNQEVGATRVNSQGHSDIIITGKQDWPCEVKRIRIGTNPSRIRNVLAKANRQIKKTSPGGSGSVVVMVERPQMRVAWDDRIPNDVSPIIDHARRTLHPEQLRSVAQLIICWDDVMSFGHPPDPMIYAFRRRSMVLDHPAPREPAPFSTAEAEIGQTMVSWITFNPHQEENDRLPLEGIDAGELNVSQLFREHNEFPDGVRSAHAIEVFSEPDNVSRLGNAEVQIVLATRLIDQGERPYVLLVIATEGMGSKPEVVAGYRLYRLDNELDLSRDALACFRALIERYGLDVSVPGLTSRFIPHCTVPPGANASLAEESDEYVISALANRHDDGSMDLACVYAIDTGKYRTALKERSA